VQNYLSPSNILHIYLYIICELFFYFIDDYHFFVIHLHRIHLTHVTIMKDYQKRNDFMQSNSSIKNKNFTPLIIGLTIFINGLIALLFFIPKSEKEMGFDVHFLPKLNAVFNAFTFIFLLAALIFILRKNVKMHRNFIFAAFTTTFLFLITYLTYHYIAPSTSYGGDGILQKIYYFVLITHITLAPVVVALALFSLTWALTNKIDKHRKIARWTMPIWLYVSLTGVLVYLLISPYY